ncbi:triple tyrosine motif-containing protein [uncultured Bacteroides sp.]|uniref:helix-turn-helix and ligand-binding sensor domain-containing protein n=1 Tax=uncultured Bacteroides sp. TaxID=162156 RepID=UPI002AAB156C|nr:triple tyrosine motif-containing protein [uncultured Bacteroides sp.]
MIDQFLMSSVSLIKSRRCLITILFFCISIISFSQINLPYVQNFSRGNYTGGSQNWSITQGNDGIMYVANNQRMLSFDGKKWKLHVLPSKSRIRSLYSDTDGRIYCGAFEEFGYWEKDIYGELRYVSLSKDLKGFRFHNDDIWSILKLKNKIIFQSFSSFFSYDRKTIKGYNLSFNPLFFNLIGNGIYTGVSKKGLYSYDGFKFKQLTSNSSMGNSDIISSVNLGHNKTLIATVSSGVYLYQNGKSTKWLTNYNAELSSAVINRTIITRDSLIIIGTIHNGIYAFNMNQQLVWRINHESGLQNNTVLGLFCDSSGNLWAALDNGISLIYMNNALRFSSNQFQKIGSVYSAVYRSPYLFLGTNQGLYYYNLQQEGSVNLIPGTSGQIWDLSVIDNQLICGHNDQTFRIDNLKATRLINVSGGACIKRFEHEGNQYLIQGTYTSLVLYKKNSSGQWSFLREIKGFINPLRYIEIDQNMNLWASHIERGLYRIKLDNTLQRVRSVKTYYSLDKTSNISKVNVFKFNGRIVFANGRKIYTYDDLTDSIIPFQKLNNQLGEFRSLHKIISVGKDKYWLIKDDGCALVIYSGDKLTFLKKIPFSLLNNKVLEQNENIAVINDNTYLFCMENALALYSSDKKLAVYKHFRLFLSSIKVEQDGQKNMLHMPLNDSDPFHIPYVKNNKIIFDVAFPDFTDKDNYFKYRLVGLDSKWTEPAKQSTIDYSRLPYGSYRLEIKAFSSDGNELAHYAYSFVIDPPFYASMYAFIIYILLVVAMVFYIKKYINNSIERDKDKMQKEQERLLLEEKERQEKNIMKLENEKLEAELLHKSKEMASSTMLIINKNKVLQILKDELGEQKKALGNQYPNKYYNKLINLIEENISSEDDWEIFQSNFDRIHENFFRNLKLRYPDITPNDLKLCAYLRLNLSTKDIAHLMNISVRGVEVARYRLRKKLNIPSEKNLIDFMIEFK